MKAWLLGVLTFMASNFLLASEAPEAAVPKPLDTIAFQLQSEDWVNTQTALLRVRLNASIAAKDWGQARDVFLANLHRINEGNWHVTEFVRSQDSSGLEKLSALAEIRLPQSQMNNLSQKVDALSKPGATYRVESLIYEPSLTEREATKSRLRQSLYNAVNEEIARINKSFLGQTYSVKSLRFVEGDMPMQRAELNMMSMKAQAMPASSGQGLGVSESITLHAIVTLAATRG